MLKDRQKSILDAVVQTYIRTAEPVSSQEVLRFFRESVSPATIRNEMLDLDDEGFLEQPHTSAGRVPTDKGYRFFVDHLIGDVELTERETASIDALFSIREQDAFIREFSKTIARLSGMLTAVGLADEPLFYETGFAEILDEPEFSEEPGRIKEFGRIADMLEDVIRSAADDDTTDDRIFIGGENPLHVAHSYTMIMTPWHHRRGFKGVLALVGPRRTDYARHKAIIDYLKEI